MINIKYCKECGEAFDIDTSCDLCPKCRGFKDKDWGVGEDE